MDVEASRTQRVGGSSSVRNPYSDSAPAPGSAWHPVSVLRKGSYMGVAVYGLHHYGAYGAIMTSPKVSHEWFKVALASSIGEY